MHREYQTIQYMQVLHAMAGKFREGRHGFGAGPPLADDQLVLADIDRLPLADLKDVLAILGFYCRNCQNDLFNIKLNSIAQDRITIANHWYPR